jgi:enoyl-CoA hydratase/carnithine racemase
VSQYARYECLKVEVADKVATVTLNRPQARNAINQKLIRELRTIWDDLADDHAVHVVVLTGAGDFFSVGGDVKAMSERPGGDVLEEGEIHDPMISRRGVTRQLELDKPIIAAINGDAIGLAATHALLCDITVMAEDARIGDTHVSRVGLVAGDGGTVIWPLLIGINKAKEFLIRGTLLKGPEAERIGLVNHIAPRAEVPDGIQRLAAQRARRPSRREHPRRARHELAGGEGGDPDAEDVGPLLVVGLRLVLLVLLLVVLGQLAGLDQDQVLGRVPAERERAGAEDLVHRLVEGLRVARRHGDLRRALDAAPLQLV